MTDLSPLLAQQPGFDRLCAAVAATPTANQIVQTTIENKSAAGDFESIAAAAWKDTHVCGDREVPVPERGTPPRSTSRYSSPARCDALSAALRGKGGAMKSILKDLTGILESVAGIIMSLFCTVLFLYSLWRMVHAESEAEFMPWATLVLLCYVMNEFETFKRRYRKEASQ